MTATDQTLADDEVILLSLRGPAPTSIVVGYGFWLFLLSDILLFATLFAAYAVLSGETAGGPSGAMLFNKTHVFIETACLLTSSFTCGLSALAIRRFDTLQAYIWMGVTFALGFTFLTLEVSEFGTMIAAGDGPSRSAFLSAFFALVGTHGLHVTVGLFWLAVMMLQVATLGLHPMVRRRLFCFGLFWHALDIVWVAVFTIVYLGAHR